MSEGRVTEIKREIKVALGGTIDNYTYIICNTCVYDMYIVELHYKIKIKYLIL